MAGDDTWPAMSTARTAAGRDVEKQGTTREREPDTRSEGDARAAALSPSQAQERQAEARTRLPQTASPVPAVVLLGAASLADAGILRVARRQRRK